MATKSASMVSIIFLMSLLMATFHTTGAQVGVCYGMLGGNLPSKPDVINLYRRNNIKRMRLYDPNREALEALRNSGIEVMLGVPNPDLQNIASNQDAANRWVQDNVRSYSPSVNFRYIAVGNEVKPEHSFAQYLVPAMRNIRTALNNAGLSQIRVSTAIETNAIVDSFPPSRGAINPAYRPIMDPVIGFLNENRAPLLVNLYTFFARRDNPSISLDYALIRPNAPTVRDDGNGLVYNNLFDAILDAVYAALEKSGGGGLEIVISESGWPSNGGGELTNMENARAFYTNLVGHVNGGTPKKRGQAIETYLFAMFDEDQKTPDYEKFFGIFLPNQQSKYNLQF